VGWVAALPEREGGSVSTAIQGTDERWIQFIPPTTECSSYHGKEVLALCPGWRVVAEDGTTLTAWREGAEVNGSVRAPDGSSRRAYDPIRNREEGSLPMRSDWDHIKPEQRATDDDIQILNWLREFALAETWDEIMKRAVPCPHTDCERWDVA